MRETPEYEALDERTRGILIAVVRNFIQTADPVGSRTISKRYNFGLSPATIRNVMSDLEELGFLEQPHTSAGRVPTDKGYRCYVDHLHTVEIPSPEEAGLISQRYRLNQGDTDDVISTTSQLLSEISRYASVVPSGISANVGDNEEAEVLVLPVDGPLRVFEDVTEDSGVGEPEATTPR